MGHCSGGPGPNTIDAITALENWVEKGIAPDKLIATKSTAGKVERTRPLCPYPAVARYTGKGSIDEAASFVCVVQETPSPRRTSQQQ
jgi:feruloyl esterase